MQEGSGLLHRSVSLIAGQLEPGTSHPGIAREPADTGGLVHSLALGTLRRTCRCYDRARFLGFFGAVRFLITIV